MEIWKTTKHSKVLHFFHLLVLSLMKCLPRSSNSAEQGMVSYLSDFVVRDEIGACVFQCFWYSFFEGFVFLLHNMFDLVFIIELSSHNGTYFS